jgi:hypothetical protein
MRRIPYSRDVPGTLASRGVRDGVDDHRFDEFARLLARRAPRRSVLRGLLVAFGLLSTEENGALAAQDSVPSEVWYYALNVLGGRNFTRIELKAARLLLGE